MQKRINNKYEAGFLIVMISHNAIIDHLCTYIIIEA